MLVIETLLKGAQSQYKVLDDQIIPLANSLEIIVCAIGEIIKTSSKMIERSFVLCYHTCNNFPLSTTEKTEKLIINGTINENSENLEDDGSYFLSSQ